MSNNDAQPTDFDWLLTSFDGARREQLRRWAQLPLEEILPAVEEMEDLAKQIGAERSSSPEESLRDEETAGE